MELKVGIFVAYAGVLGEKYLRIYVDGRYIANRGQKSKVTPKGSM